AGLQTDAGKVARSADARIGHQGPADRPASGTEADLFRTAARLQEIWQERPGDLRNLSARRLGGGRDLHRALDEDRSNQSRSRPHLHEYRHYDFRAAIHGLLARLWAWQHEREFARVRSHDVDGKGWPDAAHF